MYNSIFTDFDYDYQALGAELGEDWVDSAYRDDTCPRFDRLFDNGVYYTLFFDYKDPEKSEHSEFRARGEMKQFELTTEFGDPLFSTDNWEKMKKAILEDKIVEKDYDRVYCSGD